MTWQWTLKFEVAFDINPADEPTAPDWTDLSSRLRHDGIECSTGAGRLVGGGEGHCSLTLDNRDRAIDPTNPSATLNLIPMRHARLTTTIPNPTSALLLESGDALLLESGDGLLLESSTTFTTYPLFRGFVDAWPPMWSPVDSTIGVELVDGFAWLALQVADIDRPAETTDARITALLDAAGWPAGRRDIDAGIVDVQPLEQPGANILRTILDTAEAESGDLFVASDGTLTFRNRHARFYETPDITFGDSGVPIWRPAGGGPGVRPVYDTAVLTNVVRVELEDGEFLTVTATDIDAASTSLDDFENRVEPLSDLSLSSPQAEGLAQWEVYRYMDPHVWIEDLATHGRLDGVLSTVLPRRVGDLARIDYLPPAGGAIDELFGIDRISHQIRKGDWLTKFDLSPHFPGPWLELDNVTLGLLGVNKLAP